MLTGRGPKRNTLNQSLEHLNELGSFVLLNTEAHQIMRRILRLLLLSCCFSPLAMAQVPSSNHVYLIIEENHSNSSIIGNGAMPYLNSLAQRYGYASQYYAN